MSEPFKELGDAISDQRFVDVDLALRRGQHIDHDDADWYAYLLDAQAVLEPFYRRYSCELIHRSDGYFFLLPTGEKVPKRLLGVPEMIVGQGAALLYLDPSTIESGGVVTRDDLLSHLAAVMGTDALVAVFNPKRKRMDERVAQETVRQRVAEGLRKLTQLGFVTVSEDNRIHLRSALMRFADPVRGAGSPRDALEKLIARGEVSIPNEAVDESDDDVDGADAGEPNDDPELTPELHATDDSEAAHDGTAAADHDAEEVGGDDDAAPRTASVDRAFDDETEEEPYVFDLDADEDSLTADQDYDLSTLAEPDPELDGSFGLDFDEPPASKAAPEVAPDAPGAPPAPAQGARKPRKSRRTESLSPETETAAALPTDGGAPSFDELD